MSKIRVSIADHKKVYALFHEQGLSERQVERATGISRDTCRRLKKIDPDTREEYEETTADKAYRSRYRTPQRCPECGGRVYLPCKACEIRALVCNS